MENKMKQMILRFALLGGALLLLSSPMFGDNTKNTKAKEAIKQFTEKLRKQEPIVIDYSTIKQADPEFIIDELASYENDPDSSVRYFTQKKIYRFGLESTDPNIRKKSVDYLCNSLKNRLNSGVACRCLLSFSSDDFSEKSKSVIRQFIQTDKATPEIVMLCGIADMRDQLTKLKTLADDKLYTEVIKPEGLSPGVNFGSTSWSAHLVLARMGRKDEVEFCIKTIQSVKDTHIRSIVLIKYLAYIKQPEIIPTLQSHLESEEYITVDGNYRYPYWQYALNILTHIVDGFPVKAKDTGYSLEEVATARAWLKTHKDVTFIKTNVDEQPLP
jgi:hypothetical protein